MKDRWIYRRLSPAARMRLFCFPYAGSGSSIYSHWQEEFPEEIEVCLVELPGRRARIREPLIRRVEPLVASIADGLAPYLDMPFALFGHSFGALLGYELYHHLRRTGLAGEVRALFLSGASALHLPRGGRPLSNLPDGEFITEVRRYGGIPDVLLNDPDMMATFVPILRADFEAFEYYRPEPRPPLPCPVFLCGGERDEFATPAQVEAWRELVTGPVSTRFFPGGHFYLNDQRGPLTAHVARQMGALLVMPPAPRGPAAPSHRRCPAGPVWR